MKINEIVTLAGNGAFPILGMKSSEQMFFACLLTVLKVNSKHFYVGVHDDMLWFSYFDSEDKEYVGMLRSQVSHSGYILDCIAAMPSACEMTALFDDATRYSLLSLYGELVHCWLIDYKKGDPNSGMSVCMYLIYDSSVVPGLAEELIEVCEKRGMFEASSVPLKRPWYMFWK